MQRGDNQDRIIMEESHELEDPWLSSQKQMEGQVQTTAVTVEYALYD